MTPLVVEMKNVSFGYRGRRVIQDADMEIRKGDFVAMIGPNGGGKTTLIKLILGLLKPDRGTIRVMGTAPSKAVRQVGYVPQDVHINRDFPITALDVVMMGALGTRGRRFKNAGKTRRGALESLDRMGMAEFALKKIGDLSGGQRQRVLIARALFSSPGLLLLDEPTAAIDARARNDFFRLLKEINQEISILMAGHDLVEISAHVKSVACVNKTLHRHEHAEITEEMMACMYPDSPEDICPVDLIVHGLRRRAPKKQGVDGTP
ncbi:conserved hypothetical protein [Candidatus Desulfarcum epimagneticum]|uniref:ABC transporter domain-containing protein n=1 Tax=uncultured Desulfobacteraceae bacterium TaxID=218296 RepID=A0A484HG25_9BACT|nr:conserved hypothetical protein [uncultured Desulfobacteraceae bacterium]